MRLRVREIAESQGISLSKLSRIADVNYKTVQTIWRNPEHGVNTKTLERIAKALNVEISDLFDKASDT